MNFKRDWAKHVVSIVPTTTRQIPKFYRQNAKYDLDLWLHDPNSIFVHQGPPYIHKLCVKFESDRANTVVHIVSTRFYRQSANLTLTFDRTTENQYIIYIYIGLFLSSSTTCVMVKFESDWVKTVYILCPQGCIDRVPQGCIDRVPNLTFTFIGQLEYTE